MISTEPTIRQGFTLRAVAGEWPTHWGNQKHRSHYQAPAYTVICSYFSFDLLLRHLDSAQTKRSTTATNMATRAVLQTFERYQKERVAFVSAVAEMAKSPQARERTCKLLLC
jgi:hypothetical protein